MTSPQGQQVLENNEEIRLENFYDNANSNFLLGLNEEVDSEEQVREQVAGFEEVKLLVWNASGLLNSYDRLIATMRREDAVLALVTEAWLHPDRSIQPLCKLFSVCKEVAANSHAKNGIAVVLNPDCRSHPLVKSMFRVYSDPLLGCYLVFQVVTTMMRMKSMKRLLMRNVAVVVQLSLVLLLVSLPLDLSFSVLNLIALFQLTAYLPRRTG